MQKHKSWLIFLLIFSLTGCSRHYLSVCQQKINRNYLASTYVATPDPRQKDPPIGQMLTMYWQVPGSILKKSPQVKLYLVFWDYTEKELSFPMTRRIGYVNYKLIDEEYYKKKGLLTYRAEIVTADGQVYKQWKHQLWVNLIKVDEECNTSSSVEAQSKQPSVIETP